MPRRNPKEQRIINKGPKRKKKGARIINDETKNEMLVRKWNKLIKKER